MKTGSIDSDMDRQPTLRERHDYICRMVLDEMRRVPTEHPARLECRIRLCRRRNLCSGPLVQHMLSEAEMNHCRQNGMENMTAAALPACLARAPEELRGRILGPGMSRMSASLGEYVDYIVTHRLRNLSSRAYRRAPRRGRA
ncbi:hypothetical protein M8R20_23430 [Pseudomonas sp. R2.Fl]|nr:hypothetical protein [Pseudomonas sp. R2.Fl]